MHCNEFTSDCSFQHEQSTIRNTNTPEGAIRSYPKDSFKAHSSLSKKHSTVGLGAMEEIMCINPQFNCFSQIEPFALDKKSDLNSQVTHITDAAISILINQYRCYPLFKIAFQKMIESHAEWNIAVLLGKQSKKLKIQLQIQRGNLFKLSNFLDLLVKTNRKIKKCIERYLPRLFVFGKQSQQLLIPYFLGREKLEDSDCKIIEKFLHVEIKNLRHTIISRESIAKLAKLFKKAHLAMSWMIEQPMLRPSIHTSSVNIYDLYHPQAVVYNNALVNSTAIFYRKNRNSQSHSCTDINNKQHPTFQAWHPENITNQPNHIYKKKYDHPIAYCTQSLDGDTSIDIMENLVWDIAVILGCEKYFSPIKRSSICISSDMSFKKNPIGIFSEKGELTIYSNKLETRRGSMQLTHSGKLLSEYRKGLTLDKINIQEEQLAEATLVTLVLGMQAHANNITVKSNGKLCFIDNLYCLPHSNTAILRGLKLWPSYNSALLSLPGSYTSLSCSTLKRLYRKIKFYQEKLEKVESFFNSPFTKKKLNKLSWGWFDACSILNSMRQRLAACEEIIKKTKHLNLRDLVFGTLPEFKSIAAMNVVSTGLERPDLNLQQLQEASFARDYHTSLDYLTAKLGMNGISPIMIKELCNTENNFECALNTIFEKHKLTLEVEVMRSHAVTSNFSAVNAVHEASSYRSVSLEHFTANDCTADYRSVSVQNLPSIDPFSLTGHTARMPNNISAEDAASIATEEAALEEAALIGRFYVIQASVDFKGVIRSDILKYRLHLMICIFKALQQNIAISNFDEPMDSSDWLKLIKDHELCIAWKLDGLTLDLMVYYKNRKEELSCIRLDDVVRPGLIAANSSMIMKPQELWQNRHHLEDLSEASLMLKTLMHRDASITKLEKKPAYEPSLNMDKPLSGASVVYDTSTTPFELMLQYRDRFDNTWRLKISDIKRESGASEVTFNLGDTDLECSLEQLIELLQNPDKAEILFKLYNKLSLRNIEVSLLEITLENMRELASESTVYLEENDFHCSVNFAIFSEHTPLTLQYITPYNQVVKSIPVKYDANLDALCLSNGISLYLDKLDTWKAFFNHLEQYEGRIT